MILLVQNQIVKYIRVVILDVAEQVAKQLQVIHVILDVRELGQQEEGIIVTLVVRVAVANKNVK
jgi:hypothetical protein